MSVLKDDGGLFLLDLPYAASYTGSSLSNFLFVGFVALLSIKQVI
jgi:hypothetical protein